MQLTLRQSLFLVVLSTVVPLGCPGYIYIVDPGDASAAADGGSGTRVDSGSADDAAARDATAAAPDATSPAPDATAGAPDATSPAPDASTGPADSGVPDAAQPGRDATVGLDATPGADRPAPPPPSGAPYDHASEAAHGLRPVLELTGRYGLALGGGQLLASNAQGGSGLPRTTPVSSSDTLDIPAGATVHSAFLWYTGTIFMRPHSPGRGDYTNDIGGALDELSHVENNGITFSINGTSFGPHDPTGRRPANPSAVGSQVQLSPEFYAPHFGTLNGVKESIWGNRLDITGLVRGMTGRLTVQVQPPERVDPTGNDSANNGGNPAGNTTYNLCSGGGSWSMMVVYEAPAQPRVNLVVLDGTWARAWDYLFFHDGMWRRPRVRIDHAPISAGARLFIYAASSSPVATPLPTSPACSCGCGGAYTLRNTASPLGRNNYFSNTLEDPPAAVSDPMHRDRTNGPWYLHSGTLSTPIAGNDWTLFQSGQVYTEFPNLYEGEATPAADNVQPVTNENDPDPSRDRYAGHPWNGRGTVTYHGNGNANSTLEIAIDPARISTGETSSYVYFKGDQKDVWKPQQIVSVKYIAFTTPVP